MWVKYTHFSHGKTAPKIYRQWRRSSTFHSCWVDVWRVILFYGLQGGNPMNLVFKSYPFEYLLDILCYFGFLSCVLVCTSFCVISWCLISFHVIAVHCICSYLYLNRYIYIYTLRCLVYLFIDSFTCSSILSSIHSFHVCVVVTCLFHLFWIRWFIHPWCSDIAIPWFHCGDVDITAPMPHFHETVIKIRTRFTSKSFE